MEKIIPFKGYQYMVKERNVSNIPMFGTKANRYDFPSREEKDWGPWQRPMNAYWVSNRIIQSDGEIIESGGDYSVIFASTNWTRADWYDVRIKCKIYQGGPAEDSYYRVEKTLTGQLVRVGKLNTTGDTIVEIGEGETIKWQYAKNVSEPPVIDYEDLDDIESLRRKSKILFKELDFCVRKWYGYGKEDKVFIPKNHVPDFQIFVKEDSEGQWMDLWQANSFVGYPEMDDYPAMVWSNGHTNREVRSDGSCVIPGREDRSVMSIYVYYDSRWPFLSDHKFLIRIRHNEGEDASDFYWTVVELFHEGTTIRHGKMNNNGYTEIELGFGEKIYYQWSKTGVEPPIIDVERYPDPEELGWRIFIDPQRIVRAYFEGEDGMAIIHDYHVEPIRKISTGEDIVYLFSGEEIKAQYWPSGTTGRFYFVILLDAFSGIQTFVSPIICGCDGLVSMKWSFDEDMVVGDRNVIAKNPYSFEFHTCSEIAMPHYEFEEEVDERDGHFFPLKQISRKVYRFNFRTTEEMCDLLQTAQLADQLKISTSEDEYEVTGITITPTWLSQGRLANVEVEFTTDTIVKKTGRFYDKNM